MTDQGHSTSIKTGIAADDGHRGPSPTSASSREPLDGLGPSGRTEAPLCSDMR